MRWRLLIALSLWLVPVGARAQASEPPPPTWREQVSKYVTLRKGFDGGKDENEAAAFGYIDPGKDSPAYWLVDAGVRTVAFNWQLNDSGTLETFVYPSVEWHHMSGEPVLRQDATNKGTLGANGEVWLPPLTDFKIREALIGKAKQSRNFIKDTSETAVTLALESCAEGVETHENGGWEGGVRPCAELTYNGKRKFHYYPYIGFERYDKLAISNATTTGAPAFDGSLLMLRVQADAYPFNDAFRAGDIKGLVLNVEFAYRHLLEAHDGFESRHLNMFKLAASYFFTKGQTVGVGFTLDTGRYPEVNFVSMRRMVIALRLKTL